jgi:L-lysine 6-transaminase
MINSIYKIKIDPKRSHNSYVFDLNTNREYLDFMSMYSSLPLGYNHPIFDEQFHNAIREWSSIRITNCEHTCEEREYFEKKFMEFAAGDHFTGYHFACTGALAIEHAVKAAFEYSGTEGAKAISQVNSFHGITSYGNMLTSRIGGTSKRLEKFPFKSDWPKFETPEDLILSIEKDPLIKAIVVEPIQCTNGDIYYTNDFFTRVRDIANTKNIPLIFDEIQTGFCTTGNIWYHQTIGIIPDILVFGKKTQVSGIMFSDKIRSKISDPSKFCVTWDGDLVDMIRCSYVIKAIEQNGLLENAKKMGALLHSLLIEVGMSNVRSAGLLVAFDMVSLDERNLFVLKAKENGLLVNPTGERSIRLRPNLAITEDEILSAVEIIKKSL